MSTSQDALRCPVYSYDQNLHPPPPYEAEHGATATDGGALRYSMPPPSLTMPPSAIEQGFGPPATAAAAARRPPIHLLTLLCIRRQIVIAAVRPEYTCQTVFAAFSLVFGGFIFGFIALLLIQHAKIVFDYNPVKSRQLARASVSLSLIGFMMAVVVTVVLALTYGGHSTSSSTSSPTGPMPNCQYYSAANMCFRYKSSGNDCKFVHSRYGHIDLNGDCYYN